MFLSNASTISFAKSYFSINCNKHCKPSTATVSSAVIPVVFIIRVAPCIFFTIFGTGVVDAAVLPLYSLTVPQRRAAVVPAVCGLTPVVVVAICGTGVIIQALLSINCDARVWR